MPPTTPAARRTGAPAVIPLEALELAGGKLGRVVADVFGDYGAVWA